MVIARLKSIATCLHERSRRGILDGLGRFIQADNHSAVDVGHLRQGTRSLLVKKNIPRGGHQVRSRWVNMELMRWARSGPSSTQSTLNSRDEDRRWLMRTGMLWAVYKEVEGKAWEELYCHNRESKTTGAKKPSESQRSESSVGNESGLGQE